MKRLLIGIGVLVVMAGCSSSVPIKIDATAAKELPEDVALNYLIKINNEKRKTGFFDKREKCVFQKNGVTPISRYSEDRKLISYDDVVASAEGSNGFLHGTTSYAFLYLRYKKSSRYVCPIIADALNVNNKGDMDKINKIMTAVKSLGVKVETNK